MVPREQRHDDRTTGKRRPRAHAELRAERKHGGELVERALLALAAIVAPLETATQASPSSDVAKLLLERFDEVMKEANEKKAREMKEKARQYGERVKRAQSGYTEGGVPRSAP